MTMRGGPSDVALIPGRHNIPALIGVVDIYPTEEHDIGADVTRYPVESGAALVDNVVIRPKRLRLGGRTADLLPAPGNSAYPGRASDAWQTLIFLMERRERMTVVTMLGDYDDMVISRLKAPVDVRTGRSLRFEMELQEILVGVVNDAAPLTSARVSGPATDRTAEIDRGQWLPDPIDGLASSFGLPPDETESEHQGFYSLSSATAFVRFALGRV